MRVYLIILGFHDFEGGRLIQVKIIVKARNGTDKLWPLNTGDKYRISVERIGT